MFESGDLELDSVGTPDKRGHVWPTDYSTWHHIVQIAFLTAGNTTPVSGERSADSGSAGKELPKSPCRQVWSVVATDGADGKALRCPLRSLITPTATLSLTKAVSRCATLGLSTAYGGGGVGLRERSLLQLDRHTWHASWCIYFC